jgi:hypothetical protein
MILKNKFVFGMIFLIGILLVVPSMSAVYSNSRVQATAFGSSSASYLAKQGVNLYSSSSGLSDSCGSGQDFVLQIHPLGCNPSVVTSDLLEEQNVPVFCPIVATQINPFVEIQAIDSMTFSGQYPPEVSGVGFHPAQAAVRSQRNNLLNYPILDNVGYAVIVLKQQENESAMPEFVSGNLTAKIRYDIENAFGFGDSSFALPEMSEGEWDEHYKEYSFWNGKGFLKAESVEGDRAIIGVYENKDDRIASLNLRAGQSSEKIYFGGSYCLAGLRVKLDGLDVSDTRVRFKIDDDYVEVGVRDKFLENRCQVSSILTQGLVKRVKGYCLDDERKRKGFDFIINPKVRVSVGEIDYLVEAGESILIGDNRYYVGAIDTKGVASLDENLVVLFVSNNSIRQSYLAGNKLNSNGLSFYGNLFKKYRTGLNSDDAFWDRLFSFEGGPLGILRNQGGLTSKNSNELVSFSLLKGSSIKVSNIKVELKGFANVGDELDLEEENSRDVSQINDNENYEKSINIYEEELLKEYKDIGQVDKYGIQVKGAITYSEKGLKEAIELAVVNRNFTDRNRLLGLLKEHYNTKENLLYINEKTNNYLDSVDESLTGSFYIGGRYRSVSFVDVFEPTFEDYGALISVSGSSDLYTNGQKKLTKGSAFNFGNGKFVELVELQDNKAVFSTNLEATDNNARKRFSLDLSEVRSFSLKNGSSNDVLQIRLEEVNLNRVAKVSIVGSLDNSGTEANVSFSIGIEKRNIELSPDKIARRIEALNESIEKWGERSEKLGNTVEGLQKACVATAGVLAVKNLFLATSGQVRARKQTMEDIRTFCNDEIVRNSEIDDMRDCINKNGERINELQSINEEIVQKQDSASDEISDLIKNNDKIVFGDVESKKLLIKKLGYEKDQRFSAEHMSVDEILEQDGDIKFLKNSGSEKFGDLRSQSERAIDAKRERIKSLISAEKQKQAAIDSASGTILQEHSVVSAVPQEAKYQIVPWDGKSVSASKILVGEAGEAYNKGKGFVNVQRISVPGKGEYLAILSSGSKGDRYGVEHVYSLSGSDENSLSVDTSEDLAKDFGEFRKAGEFNTALKNAEVRYFGSAPDKDLPAIVPFPFPGRENNGYYVAVRHTFLGSSYQASGSPKSYYVCNAGPDGEIDFNANSKDFAGGDICTGFNVEAGALVHADIQFGLSESETKALGLQAQRAIQEAQRKFGQSGAGSILGMGVNFGGAVFAGSELQCQDFMSPSDCAWLFNLCDPVICPSSRCDFGGAAPRADVVQSGIIGSLLLCLPNFGSPSEGGVVIPVCLSGLKAGIDGYLSLLEEHRDCLIEKQETGRTIGICDEIYSVNLCSLFWQEATQFKDIIIPKVLQFLTRGSIRGGSEYTNAADAWSNARESLQFFTRNYAGTAAQSFKAQSTEVVKSEFCKNSISAVMPELGALESLTEVASPPQFHAKFEEIPFTDATVPPTSQYRVSYHIFAGNNIGVNYQVYLKSPTEQSIYQLNPFRVVASGYIPVGESFSEKADFTAPSGYREVCVRVNNQEECGFKIVSSSFAVDYVTDQYVSSQAEKTKITTESECISGGHSLQSFANPNLQGGISEFASPDLYSRGIVRICSSQVPDGVNESTSRWKEVGYCDDTSIKCWIDTNTVKKAIEFQNIEENTLEKVSAASLDSLAKEGYLTLDQYNSLVDNIRKDFASQTLSGTDSAQALVNWATKIDELVSNKSAETKGVFWDWQKAELTYLKANIYRTRFLIVIGKIWAANALDVPVSGAEGDDEGYSGAEDEEEAGGEDEEVDLRFVTEEGYSRGGDESLEGSEEERAFAETFVKQLDDGDKIVFNDIETNLYVFLGDDNNYHIEELSGNKLADIGEDGSIIIYHSLIFQALDAELIELKDLRTLESLQKDHLYDKESKKFFLKEYYDGDEFILIDNNEVVAYYNGQECPDVGYDLYEDNPFWNILSQDKKMNSVPITSMIKELNLAPGDYYITNVICRDIDNTLLTSFADKVKFSIT